MTENKFLRAAIVMAMLIIIWAIVIPSHMGGIGYWRVYLRYTQTMVGVYALTDSFKCWRKRRENATYSGNNARELAIQGMICLVTAFALLHPM